MNDREDEEDWIVLLDDNKSKINNTTNHNNHTHQREKEFSSMLYQEVTVSSSSLSNMAMVATEKDNEMNQRRMDDSSTSSSDDPLFSNILLQSYNVSDHEAVIQIVPNNTPPTPPTTTTTTTTPTRTHRHTKSSFSSSSTLGGVTATGTVPPSPHLTTNMMEFKYHHQQQQQQQSSSSLQKIKMKLESKQVLKNNFMDHPIQLFPILFIRHFLSCILWNNNNNNNSSSSLTIQIGFILIGIGILFHFIGFLIFILTWITIRIYNTFLLISSLLVSSFFFLFSSSSSSSRSNGILFLITVGGGGGFLYYRILKSSTICNIQFYTVIQSSLWKKIHKLYECIYSSIETTWLQSWNSSSSSSIQLSQRFLFSFMISCILLQMKVLYFLAWTILQHVYYYKDDNVGSTSSWWRYWHCIGCILLVSMIQMSFLILGHFHIYYTTTTATTHTSHSSTAVNLREQQQQKDESTDSSKKTLYYTPFLYFPSTGIQVDYKSTSTSTCWKREAWIFLYISALWIVWISPASYHSTKYTLIGPFLISMGCFLLMYPTILHEKDKTEEDDSFTRILRYSIKLTLHDILLSIGENVTQDEMLQIALLRWIVDYWTKKSTSSNDYTTTTPTTTTTTSTRSQNASSMNTQEQDLLVHAMTTENTTADTSDHSPHIPGSHSYISRSNDPYGETLQWDDLSSMLSWTIHNLQNDMVQSSSSSHNYPPKQIDKGTTTRLQNTSLRNLQKMLDALNVDDHAKPAVLAYKQAVENFPPKKNIAIVLSIMRRCPAILTILYLLSIGSRNVLILAIVLFPMMCVEVARIQLWIQSCWLYSGMFVQNVDILSAITRSRTYPKTFCYSLPENIDSMYILFSGDQDISMNYTPPLLQVWRNILSSVYALESGLVAARYAHTAHVASKLAVNVMSIAELAWQVKDKGWLHGVSTVASEMIRDHASDPPKASIRTGDTVVEKKATATQYSRAMVDLIKNGQMLSRNIAHIWDDNKKRRKGSSRKDEPPNETRGS